MHVLACLESYISCQSLSPVTRHSHRNHHRHRRRRKRQSVTVTVTVTVTVNVNVNINVHVNVNVDVAGKRTDIYTLIALTSSGTLTC